MKPTIAKGYILIDEGVYDVTVMSVSEQVNEWYKDGEPEHKKKRWEWFFEMPDGVSSVKYYTGTNIGNKKANLTKLAAAACGKKMSDFTDDDAKKFDTDNVIGKKIQIKIIHHEDDEGQVWHRINRVKPIQKNKKKEDTPF